MKKAISLQLNLPDICCLFFYMYSHEVINWILKIEIISILGTIAFQGQWRVYKILLLNNFESCDGNLKGKSVIFSGQLSSMKYMNDYSQKYHWFGWRVLKVDK